MYNDKKALEKCNCSLFTLLHLHFLKLEKAHIAPYCCAEKMSLDCFLSKPFCFFDQDTENVPC